MQHNTQPPARITWPAPAVAALLVAVALGACRDEPPRPQADGQPAAIAQAQATPPVNRDVAALAINALGIDLYRQLAAAGAEGNLILSPLSVTAALGLLLPGTSDAAGVELLRMMRFADRDTALEALATLDRQLRTDGNGDGTRLGLANRVFVQQGFALRPDYLHRLSRWHDGFIAELDFAGGAEPARNTINDWAAGETNGLIDALMPPGSVDADSRVVLANTVYLLADWAEPFDPVRTDDIPFRLSSGERVQVPMLHDRRHVPVAMTDAYSAFELAYADSELAMLVILPADFAAFERGFSAEKLVDVTRALRRRDARLWLPKLEAGSQLSLAEPLRALGLRRIFQPGAGALSGMSEARDLHVSGVAHQTYLRIDERGTEAAAGTGIGISVTSLPPPPVDIRVDRPYLVVLRDRESGVALLIGRVTDPR